MSRVARHVPLLSVLLVAALALGWDAVPSRVAFVGGRVLTMNPAGRVAEALLVERGRIVAVGTRADIERRLRPGTRVVDLDGGALVPGFVDAHGHFPASGLDVVGVPLAPPPLGAIATRDALLARVAEASAALPEGDWLLGFGYDNTAFADARHPTRDELDRVAGSRPVYLHHVSGHMGVANSRALAALGIDEDVAPIGGGIHGRGIDGRLDGLLQERAAPPLARLLAEVHPRRLVDVLVDARDTYLAAGVTTVQNGHAAPGLARALRWAQRVGLLDQRVVLWPSAKSLGGEPLAAAGFPAESGDRFRIAAVKLVVDGSPQGLTAWLSEPYAPTAGKLPGYAGFPAIGPDALRASVVRRHRAGERLALHGNGDAAIEAIIDAVALAQTVHPRDDPRHVLVHAQTIRRDQLARLDALGLTPSFFVAHTYYWGDWHRTRGLGAVRAGAISPTGWARELGVRFSLHADAPVTPMDPLGLLWHATERLTVSGYRLGPEQRLSRAEALRALTIDAAWQSGLETSLGSLEVGKRADLVVLSDDPLTVPDLRALEVRATWIDGVERYRRPAAND